MTQNNDLLHRFLLPEHGVRGIYVQISDSLQTIMRQHQYSAPVSGYLGHLLLSSCLLIGTIKFKGMLTIQLDSKGPIEMLVAKVSSDLKLRGLAKYPRDTDPAALQTDFSGGKLAVTIQQEKDAKTYQSIVPIKGREVGAALQEYFMQSEQLITRIYMAVAQKNAAGILLQQLPSKDDLAVEHWQHVQCLADTISHNELLTLPMETMLHRLFHQEQLECYASSPIVFGCTCSQEKMRNALFMYGREAVAEILRDKQVMQVKCDFCNNAYSFNKEEVERIFNLH